MKRPQPTRVAILTATRMLMAEGNFRPSAKEVVRADGFSARAIHLHFPKLRDLHIAAIDAPTAHAICRLLPLTDEIALARVIVLGRAA